MSASVLGSVWVPVMVLVWVLVLVWALVWVLVWASALALVWVRGLVRVEPMAHQSHHLADDGAGRCRLPAVSPHQPHVYLPFRAWSSA